jgi:hypothetical protein
MAQAKSIQAQTPQDAEKDALAAKEVKRFSAYRMPGCAICCPAPAASLF